jgi:hypothetical protein
MKERNSEGEKALRIRFQSTHSFFHTDPRLNEWTVGIRPGHIEVPGTTS